ncbi:MAG: class I SAM-dependent methyltransferase [Candidatus Brocadiia bacterium]
MPRNPKAGAPELNDFGCIADVYDELVSWAPYDYWVEQLEARLRRHGLDPGDWILDAACGSGLSTVPWAQKGYHVVGADISEQMLAMARRRAREAGVEIELLQQDVTELHPERRFDAAICMHSGLDYILDDAELRRAFASIRGCLREGGLFSFDKCLDIPSFYKDDYTESRSLPSCVADFEYRWDRGQRLFEQRCIVRRTDGGRPRRTEVVYHLRATPPDKLLEWVEGAGFEMLEPLKDFTILDPGMGIFRAT